MLVIFPRRSRLLWRRGTISGSRSKRLGELSRGGTEHRSVEVHNVRMSSSRCIIAWELYQNLEVVCTSTTHIRTQAFGDKRYDYRM
jgi:hypothetical protein